MFMKVGFVLGKMQGFGGAYSVHLALSCLTIETNQTHLHDFLLKKITVCKLVF